MTRAEAAGRHEIRRDQLQDESFLGVVMALALEGAYSKVASTSCQRAFIRWTPLYWPNSSHSAPGQHTSVSTD